MIVIGGYNSSNTRNLARMRAEKRPTFHIADPEYLIPDSEIRHRPVGGKAEVGRERMAATAAEVVVGLTSGASTHANLVGDAVQRLTAPLMRVHAAARKKKRAAPGGRKRDNGRVFTNTLSDRPSYSPDRVVQRSF